MYYPIAPKTRTRTFRTRLTLVLLALTLLPMLLLLSAAEPVLSATPPPDATARCHDGYYSFSRHRRGTCSGPGGVAEWLGRFVVHEAQPQQPIPPTTTASPQRPSCDAMLWQHVYHPHCLRIIEGCVTITGTVASVAPEADGDLHIRLTLDAGFSRLLNDKNLRDQGGSLVVEPVCVRAVAQADARCLSELPSDDPDSAGRRSQLCDGCACARHPSWLAGASSRDKHYGHAVREAEPIRVFWDFLLIACIGGYLHRPYNDLSLHQQPAGSCGRRKRAPRLSFMVAPQSRLG